MSTSKKDQNFMITVCVKKTPKEVYDAICQVKNWWIGDVQGDADQVGSHFTYAYKEFHKSTQKVTELIPGKRVVWHVVEGHVSFTENKKEWTGTDLIFEISPKGEETEIKFTHRGLTPEIECFNACSAGWDFYITKSLKNFLMNGKGLDPGF